MQKQRRRQTGAILPHRAVPQDGAFVRASVQHVVEKAGIAALALLVEDQTLVHVLHNASRILLERAQGLERAQEATFARDAERSRVEHRVVHETHALHGVLRVGMLAPLLLGAQVDDRAHAVLVEQRAKVALGGAVERAGADEPRGSDHAAVGGGDAAEVARVGKPLEHDAPVGGAFEPLGIGDGKRRGEIGNGVDHDAEPFVTGWMGPCGEKRIRGVDSRRPAPARRCASHPTAQGKDALASTAPSPCTAEAKSRSAIRPARASTHPATGHIDASPSRRKAGRGLARSRHARRTCKLEPPSHASPAHHAPRSPPLLLPRKATQARGPKGRGETSGTPLPLAAAPLRTPHAPPRLQESA